MNLQAVLMSAIAEGIFKSTLNWSSIGIGAILGVLCVVLNLILEKRSLSLPPLAVGMSVYLPPIVTIPIFFGALLALIAQKQVKKRSIRCNEDVQEAQETLKRRGMLLASGLIVGESIMGILLAGSIVASVSAGGDGDIFEISGIPTFFVHIFGFAFFISSLALIYFYLTKRKQ